MLNFTLLSWSFITKDIDESSAVEERGWEGFKAAGVFQVSIPLEYKWELNA